MKTLLFNAQIVNEKKRFNGYVVVDGELISEVGTGEPSEALKNECNCIDFCGDLLLPGAIDTHVHFRDGGNGSPKGDLETESRAALKGGVTSFFDMPNTTPPTVSIEAWEKKMAKAAAVSKVNFSAWIGATDSNLSELLEADYSKIPGVKLFMGASTGNMLVESRPTIEKMFSLLKCPIAVHAESQSAITEATAEVRTEFGQNEVPIELHSRIRPRRACIESASLAIELARKTGARLSVLHLSTAEEAAMFSNASVEHKHIFAETCPHYLLFGGAEDYRERGARIKCNPAIKEKTDAEALFKAVVDGRIDIVSTDHAPHLAADKQGGALKAASGMPGVQFSLPLMLTLASERPELTIERVVELMAHNPAKIYRISGRGFIRPGFYADIVRVKPTDTEISDSMVESLCGWTPYAGFKLRYHVVSTMVGGSFDEPNPQPLKFGLQ